MWPELVEGPSMWPELAMWPELVEGPSTGSGRIGVAPSQRRLDPTLVKFCGRGRGDLRQLDQVATWDAVMGKAPTASRELGEDELDQALAASATSWI